MIKILSPLQKLIKSNDKKTDEQPDTTNIPELESEQIIKEETEISEELFKNYFSFQKPTDMLETLYSVNDKKNNLMLVRIIKNGSIDLENELEKMSEDEIKLEKPHKIVNIVKKILKFNKLKQQEGKGLKILTPNQMLSRLPINLAQLKAGNNSEKLKNEIRQLLYSLYR